MSGLFESISNEILELTQDLSEKVDQGIDYLLGASSSAETGKTGADADNFDPDDDNMPGNPLQGITETVLGEIMDSQHKPRTAWEHVDAFRHAITWSEPFIVSLLAFHVFMFLLCLWASSRQRTLTPRLIVLLLVGGLVRGGEYLNLLGAQHWKEFATQNYFDTRGVFCSIMFAAPLLVDSFIMLCLFLRESAQLLVQVKRQQIKHRNKKKKE